MIHQATKEIAAAFDEKDIRYSIEEYGENSCVKARWSGDKIPSQEIYFISDDDRNDVKVRVFAICSVPENKIAAMLRTINEIHTEYRFMKLTLDNDGDVNAEYDFPMYNTAVGESAAEIFVRFVDILDEVYPKLMKTLYA